MKPNSSVNGPVSRVPCREVLGPWSVPRICLLHGILCRNSSFTWNHIRWPIGDISITKHMVSCLIFYALMKVKRIGIWNRPEWLSSHTRKWEMLAFYMLYDVVHMTMIPLIVCRAIDMIVGKPSHYKLMYLNSIWFGITYVYFWVSLKITLN